MKAKALPAGGTIAIIAPSSRGDIDPANVKVLEERGFRLKIFEQARLADQQSAGTAQQRADAYMEAFADKSADAILATRGGNRALHILPLIDFRKIIANPKPFIGFSDGTALLNAAYAKTGLIGYHGPTLSRLSRAQGYEIDQMIQCLQGKDMTLRWNDATTLKRGKASGRMVGGNLSVFASLLGTPYMPDTKGAIVFLEDVGDQLSRYDRMLAQLRLAGVFRHAGGIIFGKLLAEGDSSITPFGFSPRQILEEHVAGLNIPVLMDAPFGHSGPLPTFPVGGMATLDADAKTLSF